VLKTLKALGLLWGLRFVCENVFATQGTVLRSAAILNGGGIFLKG
jgi:hypothetical protein